MRALSDHSLDTSTQSVCKSLTYLTPRNLINSVLEPERESNPFYLSILVLWEVQEATSVSYRYLNTRHGFIIKGLQPEHQHVHSIEQETEDGHISTSFY